MAIEVKISIRKDTTMSTTTTVKKLAKELGLTPAVEVVPMRAGDPCIIGKFYIVNEASNTITAGPFNTAGEAVEHRVADNQHVARECA